MRSEEAERKLKSRKAIVLDHQNPATKNQIKAVAASESNQWRFKHRKEPPFKKPKSESTSVTAGGPSKPLHKSGLTITTLIKGRVSAGSPLSFPPGQHGAPTSPVAAGDLVKGYVGIPEVPGTQNMNKVPSSDKEITHRELRSTLSKKSKHTRNMEDKPADLRSLLISLLQEHQSMGMSLKALEKAIGDALPNSARKMEPILKQIANFQAPGRYFLKPGLELESFKKLPQSGSSPEINRDQSPAPQKFDQCPAQDHSIPMSADANDEEQGELNPSSVHTTDIEKIDILHNSPENLGDKNVSNNCEVRAGSSSDGGSDSDSESDSSDSGSDSGSPSRSKSRSPVGSQSGSSSGSETDASSSSKQASDEDVDIMTSDDDKEPKHRLQDSDPISSRNPVPWSNLDGDTVDIGNYEMEDHHASDVIEIERDSPEENHEAEIPAANYSSANNVGEERFEEMRPSSADGNEQQEIQVLERKACDDEPDGVVNDGLMHGKSGTHERLSKGNSKICSDYKHSDGRAYNRKSSKSQSSSQLVSGAISSIFGKSPYNSSDDRPLEDPGKWPVNLLEKRITRDYTNDPDMRTGSDHVIPTRPVSDSQQLGQKSFEAHVQSGEKIPGKHRGVGHGVKHSERSFQAVEGLLMQKPINMERQSEGGLVNERRTLKSSTEGVGDKHAPATESHNRKPETMGKVKEAGPKSNSHMGNSPKDRNTSTTVRSPMMNGRSGVLTREHSDLELGEYREPSQEETHGSKKQFERSSLRHLENKPMNSEHWNSDFSRVKTSNNIAVDLGKLSPPNSEVVASKIPDGPYKRNVQENNVDDLTRPHYRSTRPLNAHRQSFGDHNDVGSQQNTVLETIGKSRLAEAGPGRGSSVEAYGDTSRKMPLNSTEQRDDPTRGVGVGPHGEKEIKKQKPKMVGVSNDRRLDAFTGSNDGGQTKKVSPPDENISSYTMYEKEEPELKGPVKDISQYKEYVKEYQEKYESYSSLKKILESYSDEFNKLGKDLEAYKGRDMKRYHEILERMRSSFRQCGERHKRLKKIFIVLHEELKCLKQMIKDFAASYKKD